VSATGGALLALAALAGCSSGKDSGGGGGTGGSSTPSDLSPAAKAKWSTYCAQRAAYMAECSPNAALCPTSTCLAAVWEDAPVIEYFDCQLAKSCASFFGDDDCIAAAGTSDAERDDFIARCTAKLSNCGLQTDYCAAGLPIVRKLLMHAVDACLTNQCTQIQGCFDALALPDCWHQLPPSP
jgi:hypothetical protein